MKVRQSEDGQAEIFYDDETVHGNQLVIGLEDKIGIELAAQLCAFYESKGYNVLRQFTKASKPLWFKRILGGFKWNRPQAES